MSNSSVGGVYAKIIDDVVNLCRAPFEEEGAQASVLDDFKREWQNKISARRVAQMPWNPTPTPVSQNLNAVPPTRPQPYAAPATAAAQPDGGARVKQEPGASYDLQTASASQATTYSSSNAHLAHANATQQLREMGDKANLSLQKLNESAQETVGSPHGQKRPLPAGSPTQENPDSKRRVTEQLNSLQAQTKLQQINPAQQRQSTVGAAQTDGAADWKSMVAQRMSISKEDIMAADRSIMDLIKAQWQSQEGNGLMLPVSDKKHKTPSSLAASIQAFPKTELGALAAGYDGVDDDDDDDIDIKEDPDDAGDADAINSDLDDDEEEQVDNDDDEDPQQLIVCTYEKVARVKNKWKCTLKDGILITGGQEYVFNRATGEFEW